MGGATEAYLLRGIFLQICSSILSIFILPKILRNFILNLRNILNAPDIFYAEMYNLITIFAVHLDLILLIFWLVFG